MARRPPFALLIALFAAALLAGCRGESDDIAPVGTTDGRSTPAAGAPSPSSPAVARVVTLPLQESPAPVGSGPHDVAPARDGGVWYTGQGSGELGWLDPKTGETKRISLGRGSAPNGVIIGRDGAPCTMDGGLNAIARVDPRTSEVRTVPLLAGRPRVNLNTASFEARGVLWFTGQGGVYGRLDPKSGEMTVYDAPRGAGPYGVTTTPVGAICYASLAGSHIAGVDIETGRATVLEPPTPRQGARRVWSNSTSRIWVSEWNAGQLGMYGPPTRLRKEWQLPGANPQPYAVYVDEHDDVWLSDFGANAMVRFDPRAEAFEVVPLPSQNASVCQILGRQGELWGAESGADKLVLVRVERR